MKTRNRLLTIGSVAIAAGSITAGVLITSTAMADEPAADHGATLHLIGPDPADASKLISCTFEGVPLEGPAGAGDITITPGRPATAAGQITSIAMEGGSVRIEGTSATPTVRALPALPAPPDGGDVVTSTLEAGELPQVVAADGSAAREGTAEECAALREDMPDVADPADVVTGVPGVGAGTAGVGAGGSTTTS